VIRRRAAAVWLVVASSGGIAFAQSPPNADRASTPTVEIAVIGSADDLDRVKGLVEAEKLGGVGWTRADRFDPTDVLAGDSRPPDKQAPTVRCWVDLRDPRRARLYFAVRSGERFLVRDVALSGRFDEVDRAALTEVLELSITALIENERVGLTRAEARALLSERAAPSPPPPTARSVRPSPLAAAPALIDHPYRLGVGAFYGAQASTAGTPIAHGPGLTLLWRRKIGTWNAGAWSSGQYRLTESARSSEVGVDLQTLAVRAGAEIRWGGLASRYGVRLGAGADFVRISPRQVAPSAALTPDRWSTSFVLSAALRASVRLDADVHLSVLALVDLLPVAVRYDVQVDGAAVPVFSPWRVRPGLAVEATFR
jgi:hypothetical protein